MAALSSQIEIQQNEIHGRRAKGLKRLGRCTALADNFKTGLRFEIAGESDAQQVMMVEQDEPNPVFRKRRHESIVTANSHSAKHIA